MGRVLGLDLAAYRCGWCYGDGSSTPTANAWVFPDVGDDLGDLAQRFANAFGQFIAASRPALVCYEAPIKRDWDKLLTVRKLYGLGMVTELLCAQAEIPCAEIDLRAIKRELTGEAFATKHQMVSAAERLGIVLPERQADGREDAADAAGVWLLGLRAHDRNAAARFDRLLYSARGAML